MRTKGTGPQGLGVKGNNGYKIGSEDAPTKKKFEKHNMYSKDGKVEVAKTKEKHLSLEKKGYGHSSPAKCWSGYKRVPGTKKGAKGSCKKEPSAYASGSPVRMGGSEKSPLYRDDLKAGKETEFRKAYRKKEDMVENPHYGKKIYANPKTGVRVKLDKEASSSKRIPRKVLANLAKKTAKGQTGTTYGRFER